MLEADRRVQVTVATVRYQSLGRPRIGVTSTYLAERLKVSSLLLRQTWRRRSNVSPNCIRTDVSVRQFVAG